MNAEQTETDEPVAEVIRDIATEFTGLFAYARSRWDGHAQNVHPDLKGVGLMVLQRITRCGPITQAEVAQYLDMDKATVSRQVTKLRELGLVDVTPAADDKRSQLLRLSATGDDAVGQLRERMANDYAERFSGWSEGELETLRSMLHRFNSAD
ncbi:MarR family winged helix-turn-helix transcriptional regulator [Leucobacter sp. W1153]|uniref:MarR family winged helix-turn-helix transcriptional regulator n=1 Tax=unclassified Leucobacter TaxID=2621730 RepID=UPI003F31D92E